MFSDVVVLIAQTFEPDENGIERVTSETRQPVYGAVKSATRQEFAAAGQRGLKALYRVDVWEEEYAGQELVEIFGQRMAIYRTYRKGERIELYIGERVGVNGEEDTA